MREFIQDELFCGGFARQMRRNARNRRNDSMFLRNQFIGVGKYGMPLIRKQALDLDCLNLIACTNTIPDDEEYFDFGVHFFVDDYDFGNVYEQPERTLQLYSQYRFCCTPDYSVYGEMQPWRQIESIAHSRWCGAWWQSKGMNVVATISWDKYPSFDYCFDGVEDGSVVAIATYACKMERAGFLRGYDAMFEKIRPEAVICYGEPFSGMRGNVYAVPVCHPRKFHRELKVRPRSVKR
jgi:hypothetical protein